MQFAIDLPPLVLSVTRTWSPNQLAPVQFLPTPLQRPRIPIWVAGIWPHKKPFRRAAQFDGVYPQISGRALTPEDFQQILAFIHTQRTQTMPFDAIAYGRTSGKDLAADAVHVAAFAQAVFFHPSGLPFQTLRRRMRLRWVMLTSTPK
jgi:hypothetical protein